MDIERAVQFVYAVTHAWVERLETHKDIEEETKTALIERAHESLSTIMDGLEIDRMEFLRAYDTEPGPDTTNNNNN